MRPIRRCKVWHRVELGQVQAVLPNVEPRNTGIQNAQQQVGHRFGLHVENPAHQHRFWAARTDDQNRSAMFGHGIDGLVNTLQKAREGFVPRRKGLILPSPQDTGKRMGKGIAVGKLTRWDKSAGHRVVQQKVEIHLVQTLSNGCVGQMQLLVCRKLAAPDRKVPLSGLMHRAGQRRGQDRCSPGSRPVAEYDHPRLFSDPNRYRRRGTSPGLVTTRTGDEKVMNTTIGIDISKDHLDAHRLTDGASARFANTPDGLKALSRWLGAETCRVVYEATGRYHRDLEATLSRAGHGLVKVNPKRARRFAEAIGLEAKSDPIDAAMLARMGAALDLKPIEPPSDAMRDLHELRSARTALIKDQTACTNRLQDARARLVRKQLKARLRQIGRQIAQLDAELHQCIQDDDGLARRFNILTSIPGIGPVAAVSILADMPETGTLSSREVAALAGLAPHVRQSGKRTGRAMIAGGRAGLRCALYMPALSAIRCNPPLGQVYTALRSAGKPFRVALVAVMRKLLILANTLIREDRKWSPARPENGGEHAA